jgi:hypothetical protein
MRLAMQIDDKSTVISIVPFELVEFKPGIYPGTFRIPKCLNSDEPVLFQVGSSTHVIHVPDGESIRVETPSYVMAKAIVDDFMDGQMWISPTARPGLTYIQGTITLPVLKTTQSDILDQLKKQQKAWFVNLCNHTSDEWRQYHSTRVVSDVARFAAKFLGLEPEWLTAEIAGFESIKCPACRTLCSTDAIVCAQCRAILKPEQYKKLVFAAA